MDNFKINATDYTWLTDEFDAPEDLCLHGKVTLQIGEKIYEEHGTVSATALYLLKSLYSNHFPICPDGSEHIQMIPCCGHFLIANKDLSRCTISGCSIGLDFGVIHEGNKIKIIAPDNDVVYVDFDEYKSIVFSFADAVKDYYDYCPPKMLPEDEFTLNGYKAFWNEWYKLRYM